MKKELLTEEVLIALGFSNKNKSVFPHYTGFSYFVKNGICLFYNPNKQHLFNKYLIGFAEMKEGKIHPTQKPVKLYEWILDKYASEGAKILDTHLGSASIAVACWNMKFDLTAYEIDKEYYDKACKRFDLHSRQMALW